jgi:hypothetical protein
MYLYFKDRIDRRLEAEKLLDKLRNDAGRLVGEMIQDLNRITDRNITLMENKVNELQRILDTADKGILLMHKQTRKEKDAGRLYPKPREPLPDAAPVREEPSASGQASPRKDSPAEEDHAPRADEIQDLYRKGISPELIARRVNLPAGEVRLIISLLEQKGKNRK